MYTSMSWIMFWVFTRVDFWFCCMTTWYRTKKDCEHLWLTDAAELTHDKWSSLGPFTVAEGQIRPSRQEWTRNRMFFKTLPLTKKWPREQDPCSEHGSDWELAGKSLDYTMIKVNSLGSPCRCQQKWKQLRAKIQFVTKTNIHFNIHKLRHTCLE